MLHGTHSYGPINHEFQRANVYFGSDSLKAPEIDKSFTPPDLFRRVMILRVQQQLDGCVYDVPSQWTLARHSNLQANASLISEG